MNTTQATTKYQIYPKYKPSGIDWLGDIPEGWEVKRLKYYFDFHEGGVWGDEPNGDENDINCIRVADFDFNNFSVSQNDLTTRNILLNQHSRILNKGNLLLEKSGGGEKQLVGRAVKFDLDERAVCSNFIDKLVVHEYYSEDYLVYLMGGLYYGFLNYRSIKQTTGIQNLDIYSYFCEYVPFPKLEDQHNIADFLDRETAKIDEVVAKKQKLIELLLEKRQAIIAQAVTKGLNPKAKMKASGISWLGEIPQGWETKPLKRVVQNKVVKGVGKELPFLALEHVISGEGVLIPEYEQEVVKADEYEVFDKGQILFGKLRPYLRKFYRPNFEGCCPTEFLVLSPQKGVNDDYIFYLVQSNHFIALANAASYGVKMPRTSWEALSPNYIPLPPRDEQIAIADYLNNITLNANILINKIKLQNQKLQEFRQALISNVVTGKVKVI